MPTPRLWPRGSSSPTPGLHIFLHGIRSRASAPCPSASHPQYSASARVLLVCVPILKWEPRLQSADFFVSLSCHQDPSCFSANNILAYAFVLAGLVGLALSYALSVTNLLSGLISSFTLTETMMVSVERTEEYSTDIPMEPQDKLIQVKAQICSLGQAHLLTLCPALASWGDCRVPVNRWRFLSLSNHLHCSSFTSMSPGGDESLAGGGESWNDGKGKESRTGAGSKL